MIIAHDSSCPALCTTERLYDGEGRCYYWTCGHQSPVGHSCTCQGSRQLLKLVDAAATLAKPRLTHAGDLLKPPRQEDLDSLDTALRPFLKKFDIVEPASIRLRAQVTRLEFEREGLLEIIKSLLEALTHSECICADKMGRKTAEAK